MLSIKETILHAMHSRSITSENILNKIFSAVSTGSLKVLFNLHFYKKKKKTILIIYYLKETRIWRNIIDKILRFPNQLLRKLRIEKRDSQKFSFKRNYLMRNEIEWEINFQKVLPIS